MELKGTNYDFIIVGKKNSDCFVIKDLRDGMGGMCCASKYTIGQLLEKHNVLGVNKSYLGKNPGVNDITPMLMDGSIANQNMTFPNVKDTKRSAVTIEKGITLSRAEKAAKNAAEKKRVQTIKANQKEKKALAIKREKEAKEAAKKEAKYKKMIDKAKKKLQKSKCTIEVYQIQMVSGEYHGDTTVKAKVYMRTPAAVTNFIKLSNKNFFTADRETNARRFNEDIRRSGVANVYITVNHNYLDEFFFETSLCQLVYARSVLLDFRQDYEDYCFDATFTAPDYKWRFSGHHCDEASIAKYGFGETANQDETLQGWRSEMLRRGYIY